MDNSLAVVHGENGAARMRLLELEPQTERQRGDLKGHRERERGLGGQQRVEEV